MSNTGGLSLIPDHFKILFARRWLNFTFDDVLKIFTETPPQQGQTLILAMQQNHFNRYRLVKVVNPASGRQKRIIIDNGCPWGGSSYFRSGKSGFAPKGQTRLLPFVEAVAERLSYDRETTLNDDELASLLP